MKKDFASVDTFGKVFHAFSKLRVLFHESLHCWVHGLNLHQSSIYWIEEGRLDLLSTTRVIAALFSTWNSQALISISDLVPYLFVDI